MIIMITVIIVMIILIIMIIVIIIILTWTLGDARMEGGEVDERIGGDEKVGEEAAGKYHRQFSLFMMVYADINS